MKIESVDIFLLRHSGHSYSDYPFQPVVCRINTDEGICGFGEAGISIGPGENGVAHMLKDLSEMILGKDPLDNEVIWEDLHNRLYGHLSGGGVVVYSAMSAIDIALLDIKGKALGVPIYRLLGGKHNAELRCYLSQAQTGYGEQLAPLGKAAEYAQTCRKIMADGFKAVKINFLSYDRQGKKIPRIETTGPLTAQLREMLEERLCAIQEECGYGLEIIMENLCASDATSARGIAEIAKKYRVLFIEEATANFNPELYRVIAQSTFIPLSAGERVHTRWEFYQLLRHNAVSVIQPDICNTGGLSEAKKICDLAQLFDVRVQAHVAGTPLTEAAAMHLEAAIPNFFYHEYFYMSLRPECRSYGKYIYAPQNGILRPPELPGLGQELSDQAMAEAVGRLVVKR